MTLIDLYVAEVGRRLPLRGRSDIEAELRSTLQDMLEDRSQRSGRAVDEAMVRDLLIEYGSPDKIAASYHPTQYLIGPRLYPFFRRVLGIVFTVLMVVLLIGLGIQLAAQPVAGRELVRAVASGLGGILNSALQAFGNIVLVFAILERVLPASETKFGEDRKQWDPASLMKAVEPAEVRPWGPIGAIVFTVAALIIFNAYPQLIGIAFLKNGQWTSVPALTDAFFRWLPYINVLWLLQLGMQVTVLRQGRWQAFTRWWSILLDVAGMAIGALVLTGPSIVGLSTAALQSTGLFDARTAVLMNFAVEQGGRWAIVVVIISQGVRVVRAVVRQIRMRL